MGKTTCAACNKRCKGQAIKLSDTTFVHAKCFTCKECKKELPTSAFYIRDNARYCSEDYHRLFGTKCHSCGKYVEGDVVTVLGKTYHKQCITCSQCKKGVGAGNKVTVISSEFWCHDCVSESERFKSKDSPVKKDSDTLNHTDSAVLRPQNIPVTQNQPNSPDSDFAGDTKEANDESLLSPDLLSPTSVTSGYKSDVSVDQDSFDIEKLQPNASAIPVIITSDFSENQDRANDSAYDVPDRPNYGKFFQTSFLNKGPGFKRGPSMNPQGKNPQHFHRPDGFSYRTVRSDISKPGKKGMINNLVKQQQTSPFREAPYQPIKTQEPIQLAKIPDAQVPSETYQMPVERDDFVAPPEPAAIYPELLREGTLRRRSAQNGDLVDGPDENKENVDSDEEQVHVDPKIEKEIDELSKMSSSGAAKMMLEELKKKKKLDPTKLDPRSCSRTPSAALEPQWRTRYESPVFASPSRDRLRRKPFQNDEVYNQAYRTYSSPVPRPGYGGKSRTLDARMGCTSAMSFRENLLNNSEAGYRSALDYYKHSATLDSRNGYVSDTADGFYPSSYMFYHRRPESSSGVLERSYSPTSDVEEYDSTTGLKITRNMFHRLNMLVDGRLTPNPRSSLRRNVPAAFTNGEHAKVYPSEVLRLDNSNRPVGLDNTNLEQYLADDEFEKLFSMKRDAFVMLAEWKRNDLKKRVGLFESVPVERSPSSFSGIEKTKADLGKMPDLIAT